jgi:hypothetical protein
MEKHTIRLMSLQIEEYNHIYLMSDLLEGLTLIMTTIWWLQNLGTGYQ